MCKHTLSHFVCSRWVGRSPRAGLALSLHRFLVFGLLALFSSRGILNAPFAVSPEEQLAIHSGKHRPEAIYLAGSGSIFLWKGLLLIFSWSFPPARVCAVPVGGGGGPCNSSPGRSGREAVTRVDSRCPVVPTVLRSLALSHFLKEVQCSCQESLALGLQSLLLNVRPEECKKAGTAWFQSCLQGQEGLRLRLIWNPYLCRGR